MKKAAIVILNFNGEKDTIECLKSLGNISSKNFDLLVIVVDNGSKEKFSIFSGKAGQFSGGELKIIRNEINSGFSGGNNVGIKYAIEQGSDYIVILNNDTIVDKNLVEELIKTADSDTKIGIVSPKIYFAKGYEFHKDRYSEKEKGTVFWYAGGLMNWENATGSHRGVDEVDRGQYEEISETDFATGCCMLIKREIFKRIGLLDEKYYLYYEDTDFCERAKKAGYKIVYSPKAILWHKNAGSAGGSGSSLQDYYIGRNRLLFGFRYAPFRTKLALIKESLKILTKGRFWQKKGVLDFYFRKFGKGSYE